MSIDFCADIKAVFRTVELVAYGSIPVFGAVDLRKGIKMPLVVVRGKYNAVFFWTAAILKRIKTVGVQKLDRDLFVRGIDF